MNSEISQEVLDRLMNESIGIPDIAADKLVNVIPATLRINCFDTNAAH